MDKREDSRLDPRLEDLLNRSDTIFKRTKDFGSLTPGEIDRLKTELAHLAAESGEMADRLQARNRTK